jgi:hypothetical protein
MGLDQYAFARKGEEENIEIMSWRKHANLEGWMANLYERRGGKDEFNCVELKLRPEDIDKLKSEHLNLATVGGFFWGKSSYDKDRQTTEFITLAEKYIVKGYEILYTSWW